MLGAGLGAPIGARVRSHSFSGMPSGGLGLHSSPAGFTYSPNMGVVRSPHMGVTHSPHMGVGRPIINNYNVTSFSTTLI